VGASLAVLTALIILSSVFYVVPAGKAEKLAEKKDLGWIVIDEVAGQSVFQR
jgi:phosphatidylglycerophosphatase A